MDRQSFLYDSGTFVAAEVTSDTAAWSLGSLRQIEMPHGRLAVRLIRLGQLVWANMVYEKKHYLTILI